MRKRILEYLYNFDGYASLSDFLNSTDEYRVSFEDSSQSTYDPDNSILVAVLEQMEADKVIVIEDQRYRNLKPSTFMIDMESYNTTIALTEIEIKAMITQAGRREIEEIKSREIAIKVNQSILDTNDSVGKTNQSIIELNKFQRVMSWVTAGIAFLAAVFAFLPLLKKDEVEIKNLEPLLQQQKEIRQAIEQIKLVLPSPPDSSKSQ
jgi:hypothetical protein